MNHPDAIVSLADRFQQAALTGRGWTGALERLAAATGSSHAQLIGFDDQRLMFNWVAGMDDDSLRAFDAINGHDPRINSRVRIGSAAPELAILTERDFSTADDMATDPGYRDWIENYGARFFCLSPLWRDQRRMVGLSIARTPKEGDVSCAARDLFARIAPHVRTAARTMMMLGDRTTGVLAESLGDLNVAAFICGADGRLYAASRPGAAMAENNRWLVVRHHRLRACGTRDQDRLTAAIHTMASIAGTPPPQRLALRSHPDGDAMLVDIMRLPGESKMRSGRVLVIAHPPRADAARRADGARMVFGFTATETAVVAQLMAGQSPLAIARTRDVSIGTIRTHIRHIFDKAGVTSQIELLARLAVLIP